MIDANVGQYYVSKNICMNLESNSRFFLIIILFPQDVKNHFHKRSHSFDETICHLRLISLSNRHAFKAERERCTIGKQKRNPVKYKMQEVQQKIHHIRRMVNFCLLLSNIEVFSYCQSLD